MKMGFSRASSICFQRGLDCYIKDGELTLVRPPKKVLTKTCDAGKVVDIEIALNFGNFFRYIVVIVDSSLLGKENTITKV